MLVLLLAASASAMRMSRLSSRRLARVARSTGQPFASAAPVDAESPFDALSKTVRARDEALTPLSADVLPSIASFLNENAASELLKFTLKYTEVGKTAAKKNMWSRGR